MNNKVESAFYKTIMEGVAKYVKKNTPTYTTAKVVSIDDDGTPYVRFPGAETTTPVTTVTNAAKGDEVLVQVNSNGDAYVYGNLTDQPVSKVEIDKITENTTNVLQQFEYSLDEIIEGLTGKFVEIGDSDIQVLSSNIIKNSKGLNLFSGLNDIGDEYIHTDETGMDIKTVITAGELNDTVTDTINLIGGSFPHMHFGRDYILYGQTWQTYKSQIGNRAIGFGNVRPNSTGAFAVGNQATVQANSNYGTAFNSATVQNSAYGFAANDGTARDGGYAAAFNKAYADAEASFATGSSGNFAKGMYSAVFGNQVIARGKNSFAEGYGESSSQANTANGVASHVAGYRTKTGDNGHYSFVSGMFNISNYLGQTVIGRANVNKSDTLFEVGNGEVQYSQIYSGYPLYTKISNSNAFEVTGDGYIRTGIGMEKIGFGKESNSYGYFIPPDLTLPQVLGYYYNTKFYEEPEHLTEITGESGKLYKDQTSGATILLYRWENDEFIDADTPVFIAWGSGGGVVYTAGDGIDISPTNEISVDDSIARMTDIPTVPTNVSAFVNDAGYLTQHQDLSNYIQKSLTAGLVKNDGTIDTTDYAEASDIPDVSNFISKSQTSGLVKNDGTIDTTTYATASSLAGYLPLAGGTMTGAINSQHIVPATDDSYRLGSSTSKYNSAYIKRIYNLASIESTTDGSKRLLVPAKSGTIAVNEDLPNVVGNLISVTPILESGTLIANVTISGVSTNLYAPSGGSSYTAGDGIDISNDEISVDNTIARLTDIPDELADLSDDSTHRLVTDTEKSTWNGKSDFSGSYNDLSDKPTIPAAQVNSDWNASSGISQILNKPTLATVATSGSYNDLSNKPSIPTLPISIANGGTGGTTVAAARANLDVLKNVMYGGYYPSSQTAGWYTIFEFPVRTMTLAILQIISEEYENSSAIVFINGRYAQQGTTGANQSPEVTLFGNVDYGTAGGYTKFRITQNGANGRLALDIYANGRGANLRIKVLYCDVTDYNVYSTLTPAVYSTVLREVQRNFLDSIETTGNLSLRDSIYMSGAYVHTGNTPKNADSWSEFLNNSGVSTGSGINICQGISETSGIHMDGDTIVMWSPCDDGALWYYDEDEGDVIFHIDEDGNYYDRSGNKISPQVNSDWNATSGVARILNKPTLATVATSGSYNDLSNKPTLSYLPLAGGTVTGTLILSRTTDASGTANNKPALIVGGTDTTAHLELDNNEIIAKANGTTGATLSLNYDGGGRVDIGNSTGGTYIRGNATIDSYNGNWISGLRINSISGNANGSAHITFGGQSGTTSGTTSSYPMYQVGKMSDLSGAFAIRAEYNGTYHDVFKASPTTGLTELLSYANGTTVNITAKEYDIDLAATTLTTSKITLNTNNLLFAGTNTTAGTITTGTGDPSRPFKFTGYESSSIAVSTTAYPSVTLNDGDLILLFLSSGAGNTFYAARLLRNNNGSLQTSNLATTGTSHATVTMRSNGGITIQNTSSSYKLNYKILRLG